MENQVEDKINSGGNQSLGQSELVQLLSGIVGKILTNRILRRVLLNTAIAVASVLAFVFAFSLFLYIIPALQDNAKLVKKSISYSSELNSDPAYKKNITALSREVQRLSRKFNSYTPGQSYLVINTTDNRFTLYRNKRLVREGFCSSGSYTRLINASGDREWIFKTPKGRFWIQSKITKPLWRRPDWAFVEEGLPIPSADHPSRYEVGVLGDYAMSLGDGYLIHGTIYKRFLGMPVTHGCVRLNDEDLEAIFNTLSIGSKVYIF
jgi:lipoprotein-anchoring transpeptidase ErfK/SrfK